MRPILISVAKELDGLEQWLESGGERFTINLAAFIRMADSVVPLLEFCR
jgi:hypothetical protein